MVSNAPQRVQIWGKMIWKYVSVCKCVMKVIIITDMVSTIATIISL